MAVGEMKLAVACDHAGLDLKRALLAELEKRKVTISDFGTNSGESVDYPDLAAPASEAVSRGECAIGLLICGTGIGMSIVANKYRGIRAAVCTTEFEARAARAHNDANVLCLGARVVGPGVAKGILEAFLDQPFEGGRHQLRVKKIKDDPQR
jgi:ribose 5-phosphate isomerase B